MIFYTKVYVFPRKLLGDLFCLTFTYKNTIGIWTIKGWTSMVFLFCIFSSCKIIAFLILYKQNKEMYLVKYIDSP